MVSSAILKYVLLLPDMTAHTFSPITLEAEAGRSPSSRASWSTGWVPQQPGLCREILSQSKQTNKTNSHQETILSFDGERAQGVIYLRSCCSQYHPGRAHEQRRGGYIRSNTWVSPYRTPDPPILNTESGQPKGGVATTCSRPIKKSTDSSAAAVFLPEGFLRFNTTLNFWPVSLIWAIVKTMTDGTQSRLVSSILYRRRQSPETSSRRSYSVRVVNRII